MSKTVYDHLVEHADQDLRIMTLIKQLIQEGIWVRLHILSVLNGYGYNGCKFCVTRCLLSNQVISLKYGERDTIMIV